MVKNFIKTGNIQGNEAKDFYGRSLSPYTQVSRKPILPTEEEISSNTRSRSAKLRIAELTEKE
jgi:16S rRNA (cytosine1402-N4)-methyltransferase